MSANEPHPTKAVATADTGAREPIALRKWNIGRDEVSILLTRRPDDADVLAINRAVGAFVSGLDPDAARLIAASPLLLEALLEIQRKLNPQFISPSEKHEAWFIANDAIAKALRQSPNNQTDGPA